MNILQISPQIPVPETDGGKISIWGNTKILSQMGHHVDFVCYRKDSDYEKSYAILSEYATPYIIDVQTDNSILGAIKNLFSPIPYNTSKYIDVKLVEVVTQLVESNKYDIVQIEHLHMGWIIEHIRKVKPELPVILRQQNLELRIMRRYYQKERNILLKLFAFIQYLKLLRYEPNLCSLFDKCIMISENDQNELISINGARNITNIPAGVNKDLLLGKRIRKESYSLVHVGNLNWFPNKDGLNWFINDVLPLVHKALPYVKLYVYGGGNTGGLNIRDEVKDNVEIVGFVSDLWAELASKELAIVPLRIGGGIRIKIIEMLGFGIPVLSTSIGKEGIDVTDNEEILIADSREEFCQKIINYFEKTEDHQSITINGRKFVEENYTWEVVGAKFEGVYKELLVENAI